MTNYEEEVMENIKRHAKHGKKHAEKYQLNTQIDFFVAILDEVGRLDNPLGQENND